MDEPVRRLEWETGKKLEKLNVQKDAAAHRVWKRVDKNRCGGFPLFYNRKTQEKICGLSTEDNLRSLFYGERAEFWCAPDEMEERKFKGETASMKSGMFSRLGAAMKGNSDSEAAGAGEDEDDDDEWEYEWVEVEVEVPVDEA
eukprot:scaffold2069_cov254-Pinguiococcus_pyrenoidosus.AAC.22